jgi:hypothetical protein
MQNCKITRTLDERDIETLLTNNDVMLNQQLLLTQNVVKFNAELPSKIKQN